MPRYSGAMTFLIRSVLLLVALATPAVAADRTVGVVVGDTRFRVTRADDTVTASRLSPPRGEGRDMLLRHARAAMIAGSGCPLRPGTLRGDTALFVALLDCPGARSPRSWGPILRLPRQVSCGVIDGPLSGEPEIDCDVQ